MKLPKIQVKMQQHEGATAHNMHTLTDRPCHNIKRTHSKRHNVVKYENRPQQNTVSCVQCVCACIDKTAKSALEAHMASEQ
jgi:hypothetical protein